MCPVNEDIVEHILDSYDHWWPRDFCRFALVSSVWLQPARKRLYAYPRLSSYRSCHSLARSLEENSTLIPLVRGADLHPKDDASSFLDGTNTHIAAVCPGVPRLLALTCLERLTLGGDLEFHPERCLRAVASPHTIKSLRLINKSGRHVELRYPLETLAWDGELSIRFHALESLTLSGPLIIDIDDMHYGDRDGHAAAGLRNYLQCTPKELILENVQFTRSSGPLCSLLLEPASWQQLRALTFVARGCDWKDLDNFVSVLPLVHDSLEQFTFLDSSAAAFLIGDLRDVLKDVPPLRCLRSLKTSYVFVHEDFHNIVGNVELLDINGAFRASHVHDWIALIEKQDGFPNLRRFILRLDEPTTRHFFPSDDSFTTLTNACRRRGINLDICT